VLVVQVLSNALQHTSADVRASAAEGLCRINTASTVKAMVRIGSDAPQLVVQALAQVLQGVHQREGVLAAACCTLAYLGKASPQNAVLVGHALTTAQASQRGANHHLQEWAHKVVAFIVLDAPENAAAMVQPFTQALLHERVVVRDFAVGILSLFDTAIRVAAEASILRGRTAANRVFL